MPKSKRKSKPKSKPKQKLKQNDGAAQREQHLLEMKQKDAEIARPKSAQPEQLEQQLAEAKLKQQEEEETKPRRCEEQMEKPVGEDQTEVPTFHSSKPVAGAREQPPSYKDALVGNCRQIALQGPCPLDEKKKAPKWFEQSESTNIGVEFPVQTNTESSEHGNEIVDEALLDSRGQIASQRTSPIYTQEIAGIPLATPVVVEVPFGSEFFVREFVKVHKHLVAPIGKKIQDKVRMRVKDKGFKVSNPKCRFEDAIHKNPVSRTIQTIYFLKLKKPSQSEFDSKDYREKHFFPSFQNGTYVYKFYNTILGREDLGDFWLRVLEESAKEVGDLEWQYFKACELTAQVNHEAHPEIKPEELLPHVQQHGFPCRGVDYGELFKYTLMAKK